MMNIEEVKVASAQAHKSLVEHAGLLLGATVVAGGANYLFHILMARSLGTQNYGVLSSLLSLFMILAFPLSTVQMVLTKYVAIYKGQNNFAQIRYLFTDFFKKLAVAGVILFVVSVLFSGVIGRYLQIEAKGPIILLGVFSLFSFLMPVALGMLQGLEHFFYLSLNSAMGALSKLALALVLVFWGYQVNGALFACVLSVLVTFGFAWFPLRGFLSAHVAAKNSSRKEVYQFFIPVFAALSCFGLLAYQDVVLVKHWFPPLQAGAYATAALLGKAFLFPAQSLAMAMFPKVSQAHSRGEETAGLLKHTLLLAAVLLGIGLAILFCFSDGLTTLLMKKEGASADMFPVVASLLRYYGFAFVPVSLLYILAFYYLGRHENRFVLVLAGATVLFLGVTHGYHPSMWAVLVAMGGCGAVALIVLLIGCFRK
jgi:O-antigen/teichoic acid export membrane protein